MNTSASPSESSARAASSSAAASQTGVRSPRGRSRYSTLTGNVRPAEVSVRHGARYFSNAAASSVADITINKRSGRVVSWICNARASVMSP